MARILLTRPSGQEHELSSRLSSLGHEIVHVPLIAIQPLGDEPIDVTGYDWVVVTSVNGARELRRRVRGSLPRVAAIGRATADALGRADLVPAVSSQEGLLAELPRPPGRVLFVAAEGARRLLPDELGADVVAVYRTCELEAEMLPEADLAVLASPSAARAYGRAGGVGPSVTIGPETTRAAVAAGVGIAAEAVTHDLDGLVAAVEKALADA